MTRYTQPIRSDFETEEEYDDAMTAYQEYLDDYLSWYEEKRRERD